MGVSEPKFEYKLRFKKKPLRKADVVKETIETVATVVTRENAPPKPIEIQKPITTRYENIIKSQQDSKNYRGVVFENGLKVVLISDPTTEKSGACLCVEVGHMSDPCDLPGIAHLTEHVVFLGSEKYPNENEFRSFVSENGGYTNAQTFADVTKYFFDIVPEKLSEALDRFAQMFISPLFKESSVVREIQAVNSEHEKNLSVDAWRTRMVNKTLANPNHPYSKFSTGNTNTLLDFPKRYDIDVRNELVEFHEKWYQSGNLMNLAIISKNSLDELEEIVRNNFVFGIENKNVEMPLWEAEVFMKDQIMTRTFIEPVMDVRSMTLSFPTPDLKKYYRSRPEEYIVNLVGHEGPGSILAELKKRGWSGNLNCDHIRYANGFGFFEIKVDLTDEGYENMDKIVKLIFQYLCMIKELGIKEWIFDEYRNLREIEFRFEDQKNSVNLVKKVASAMRHYPLLEVLSAPVIVSEWRPDLIKLVLDMLTPKNLRIVIVDQTSYWKCLEIEKIYGTRYGSEKIPASTIREWTICGSDQNLKLPQPNLFIPSDFEFLPIENWKQTFPKIIRDSSLIRVWFKQDTEFRKPKSIMTIELKNPTIHCDPLNWNLSHLFVWLLEDHLKEQFYVAELAGLECKISVTTSGIRIFIDGFSDKQDIFLETILKEIFWFKITQRRFEDTYDSYLSDLKSVKAGRPQHVAIYCLGVVLTEQTWTNEELIQSMKFVTMRRLQTFMKEVLTQTQAECFIFGNVNEKKAFELTALVEDRLNKAKVSNLSKSSLIFILAAVTMRERKLPQGIHHVVQVQNTYNKVNCTSFYIQCGVQDDKSNVILDLILQLVREPFFNILRTQEQQGYMVDCLIRRVNGAHGIKFVVESKKHPEYIEQRILSFLTMMEDELSKMTLERFESSKKALKAQKLPATTLGDQFWQFFREIVIQQFHFNRTNVETSVLKAITKEEVLSFFKTHISPQSKERKSISIHVLAKSKSNDKNYPLFDSEGSMKIEDVDEFKNSLQLYPMLRTKSLRQFYSKKR